MSGKYIQEQPESQIEKKTAAQILEDENLDEHITESMRGSLKMYNDADDDETPAIERRIESHEVGAGTSSHHLNFDTDPELEAQVAAERKQHEKEAAERAKNNKLEKKAAKAAVRHSEVYQTSKADEELYPEAKPKFDPEDEKYWRQQMSKKNPLPKQARIETTEDAVLDDAVKKSTVVQVTGLAAAIIGFAIYISPLPRFLEVLAFFAAIAAMSYACYLLYMATIGRKLQNILPKQRDSLLLASIVPGIYLRYMAIFLAASLAVVDFFGILAMVLQFFAMILASSKYYEFLAHYGIEYDVKMSVYTLILTAPAMLLSSGGFIGNGPMIILAAYMMIFKLALVIFIPDWLAGKNTNSRFRTH